MTVNLIFFVVIILVAIYTASYAIFEWNNNNKIASVATFFICIAEIVLPFIKIFGV